MDVTTIIEIAAGPGLLVTGGLVGLLFAARDSGRERRWRDGFLRGHVTLVDLRPGRNYDQGQELECTARIWLPGVPEIIGRYRTGDVGPLDASRLTGESTFPCRANPTDPRRLDVYLYDDLDAAELTGRHLEFEVQAKELPERPVPPRISS